MSKIYIKILTFVMIISLMLPNSVVLGSGSDIQAVYDELEFSMISDEPQQAVTKTLNLSLEELLDSYPDVYVEWNSSLPTVLSIGRGTATVTRQKENTPVTLTAKISSISEHTSLTKQFEINVLKRNVQVLLHETFDNVAESEKGISIEKTSLAEKGFHLRPKTNEAQYLASVKQEPGNTSNNVLVSERIVSDSADYQTTALNFDSRAKGKVNFKTKLKYTYTNDSNSEAYIQINFMGMKSEVDSKFLELQLSKSGSISGYQNAAAVTGIRSGFNTTNAWLDFEIMLDLDNSTYKVRLNDGTTDWTSGVISYFPASETADITRLTRVTIHPHRRRAGDTLYLDDVYADVASQDLRMDEKAFVTVNGNQAAIRTAFDGSNDLVQIVENLIPVSQTQEYALDFSRSGLISAEAVDSFDIETELYSAKGESPAFKINGDNIGSIYGAKKGVLVTSSAHGKDICDVGTVWQDEGGVNWTLMNVQDGDKLILLSENTGTDEYDYDFATSIDGTLSLVGDAVHTNDIIISAQTPNQYILPAIKLIKKEIYLVEDDERILLENGEYGNGDMVEIVEEYDVLNPVSLAEELSANRPAGGYKSMPEPSGQSLAKFSIVHKIDSTGQTFTTTSHEVCIDTDLFDDFGYEAVRVANKENVQVYSYMPNRQITKFSNGSSYVTGVLPVLDAKEKTVNVSGNGYEIIGQDDLPKNSLPSFIPDEAYPETDMSVVTLSYKKYFESLDGIYEIPYEDEIYLFFDFIDTDTLSTTVDLDGRDVILIDKSSGVTYDVNNGTISASAAGTNQYLVLKVGVELGDEHYAKEFIEQKSSNLGLDLTDKDYLKSPDTIIELFVEDVKSTPPTNKDELRDAFLRSQAVVGFSNIKVSAVSSKMEKYGNALGIDLDEYEENCQKYEEVEISKGLSDTLYENASGIIEAYENRIEELEKEAEKTKKPSGNGGGGGRDTTVSVSPELIIPKPEKSEITFTDVDKNHWAEEYILKLAEKNILSGFSDGSFKPDETVTREQFVKMLVLALELEHSESNIGFADVQADRWSMPFVRTAAALGIVKGYENNEFKPLDNIKREDMAVMIERALVAIGVKPSLSNKPISFADMETISDYAVESVKIIQQMGFISGMSDNRFCPNENLTRAQAAKIICMISESR